MFPGVDVSKLASLVKWLDLVMLLKGRLFVFDRLGSCDYGLLGECDFLRDGLSRSLGDRGGRESVNGCIWENVHSLSTHNRDLLQLDDGAIRPISFFFLRSKVMGAGNVSPERDVGRYAERHKIRTRRQVGDKLTS